MKQATRMKIYLYYKATFFVCVLSKQCH